MTMSYLNGLNIDKVEFYKKSDKGDIL